jgi:hypothetical protein
MSAERIRGPMAVARVVGGAMVVALAITGTAWSQSTTISRATFASGGGRAVSANHILEATMGQPVVAGGSSLMSTALPGLWPTLDFEVILDKPTGQGSLRIANFRGVPGALYFTAISLEPANASAPPWNGFWFGLTISLPLLFGEYATFTPPFVGILDANGESTFTFLHEMVVAYTNIRIYAVTVVFGPTGSPIAVSTTPVGITI